VSPPVVAPANNDNGDRNAKKNRYDPLAVRLAETLGKSYRATKSRIDRWRRLNVGDLLLDECVGACAEHRARTLAYFDAVVADRMASHDPTWVGGGAYAYESSHRPMTRFAPGRPKPQTSPSGEPDGECYHLGARPWRTPDGFYVAGWDGLTRKPKKATR
jgi:hypothetical protein